VWGCMLVDAIPPCLHVVLKRSGCPVQLNLIPGRKGLRRALGDVPSWVAFQDKEKVEVSLFQLASCRAHLGVL